MYKRILLLSIFVILSLYLKSQIKERIFLGKDYLQYKGAFFEINNNVGEGFTHTFYTDLNLCQNENDNNVIYPTSYLKYNTEKDSLINRIFLVKDILNKNGNQISNNYENEIPGEKQIFVLQDTVTKQIIYYKYDKDTKYFFVFNVYSKKIIKNFLCSQIERGKDEFTNTIKFNSPITDHVVIYKEILNSKISYYLSLYAKGSTVTVNGSGVIILFSDGTKLTKQNKITVEAQSYGFEYNAFIKLTPADLILLSTKKIKKFRLYIYDENIDSEYSERFKSYVDCIRTAK